MDSLTYTHTPEQESTRNLWQGLNLQVRKSCLYTCTCTYIYYIYIYVYICIHLYSGIYKNQILTSKENYIQKRFWENLLCWNKDSDTQRCRNNVITAYMYMRFWHTWKNIRAWPQKSLRKLPQRPNQKNQSYTCTFTCTCAYTYIHLHINMRARIYWYIHSHQNLTTGIK